MFNGYSVAELASKLNASGHDKWGWVIYRCTYNSDDDWSTFMEILKGISRDRIGTYLYNSVAEEVGRMQTWTVFEDRNQLDNASKSIVRRMFNKWVHSPEAAAEQPNAKCPPPLMGMSRNLFCMHVDEESLRSVLEDSSYWHVNIIDRKWVPEEDRPDDDDDDDEDEDEDEEILEEVRKANTWPDIEGCTDEDVG